MHSLARLADQEGWGGLGGMWASLSETQQKVEAVGRLPASVLSIRGGAPSPRWDAGRSGLPRCRGPGDIWSGV